MKNPVFWPKNITGSLQGRVERIGSQLDSSALSSDLATFPWSKGGFLTPIFIELFAYNAFSATKHPFPSSIRYAQDTSDNTIVSAEVD